MDAFRDAADEAGLEIVDEQTIEHGDEAPPTAQLSSARRVRPRTSSSPCRSGIQCISFLNELANAKAAEPGLGAGRVHHQHVRGSPLILGAAGENANGIYTSAAWVCTTSPTPTSPAVEPVARTSPRWTPQGLGDIVTTGAAGWNAGEVTVEILAEAAAVAGRADPGVDHQRRPQPRLPSVAAARGHAVRHERRRGRLLLAGHPDRPVRRRRRLSSPTSASRTRYETSAEG